MTLVHGGNVYELASRTGCSPDDILDFSASINPLGPPPGLHDLLARYFYRLQHYPDINNRLLIDSLARLHEISPECIAVGNGSTELIYWLPRALGISVALAVMPTFGEYGKAFELQGVAVHKVVCSADNGFQPRVEQLEEAVAKYSPEAVLLTHPGSPGGALLTPAVMDWVAKKSGEGRIFIVDEVFIDFCEEESFKRFLEDTPNLVLIRSLTKFYGLPGLRMGYILASSRLAERVRHFVPPWSVNTLAQAAGAYCVEQVDYRRETLELVGRARREMTRELAAMPGLRVFPGEANYLLVELDRRLPPAGSLQRDLFDSERVLIRNCGSFEGLDEWYFRVAVRLPEQNQKLIAGIGRWLGGYTPLLSP
ncbi:MAG: threonine-phosphate decarboxylase [Syntrophobacteraceae bacterium]